jgi:hypothetical protein
MTKLSKLEWQYLVIAEHRREWLGLRYFKFNYHTDTVVQVCVSPGQEKRGRGHVFGTYVISRQTLFSNYLGMMYAIPTTKREYDKAFDKVMKALK